MSERTVYFPPLGDGKPLRFRVVDETYPGAMPGKLNLVPDMFGEGAEIRIPAGNPAYHHTEDE